MRSAILNKELLDLRDRINALELNQRDILLDLVDPQPDEEPAPKAKKKSARKSSGKSQRASNMAATLNRNLAQQREATATKEVASEGQPPDRCVEALPNGAGACGLGMNDVLHQDSSYGNYHEFVAPGAQAATAGD